MLLWWVCTESERVTADSEVDGCSVLVSQCSSPTACAGTTMQVQPGRLGSREHTRQGCVWEARRTEAGVALCVCTQTSVNRPEIGQPFSSQTNGLFIKLKAAIAIRKYSIPAISPEGLRASLSPVRFALLPNNALMCKALLMEDKSSINPTGRLNWKQTCKQGVISVLLTTDWHYLSGIYSYAKALSSLRQKVTNAEIF